MSTEPYRGRAAQCLWIAERTADPQDKASLISMAQAWLLLARQAKKNASANFGSETAKPPEGLSREDGGEG
jgi:hypothetical protein